MPQQDNGFTLVEVITVVCVISILALAIIPTFSSYQDEQKLIGAANQIVADLRFASTHSKKTKTPLRIEITPASESYQVQNNATSDLIYHPISKKPYTDSFNNYSFFNGVDIVSVNDITTLSTLVFNTRGMLAIDTTIVLAFSDFSRNIFINSATGRITVK